MESPLYIPKSKKWKGLTVYCYKCQTNVSEICKQTGKQLQKCSFGDKHAFKVYVHVPGTDNERRTKKLDTRDVNEAISQAMEFEKEIKGNNANDNIGSITTKKKNREVENRPELLVEALARDIGRLNNEGVPEHRIKERSKEHIKDIERAFTVFVECLKKNGYNLSTLRIDQLTDKMVGLVYNHLKTVKGFKNRTVNKYLSHYTSFITRHNQEYNDEIQNFFETIRKPNSHTTPEILPSKETFEALLNRITPENGNKEYATGKKRVRNFYRPWLADAFRVALETGRRREEIINLKFSDIIAENNGVSFIKTEDYKVNRIRNRVEDYEKKYIFIPVTKSLKELLIHLGYEKYKESDNYILAPEVQNKRTRVMSDVLSQGFAHFYGQLKTGKKLTFKCLRKTYITNLSIYMGGNAKAITGHSDDSVIERHYLDKKALVKAAQGFEVFPTEMNRKEELEQIRNNLKQKQLNLEVEQ
jgi:integrase